MLTNAEFCSEKISSTIVMIVDPLRKDSCTIVVLADP
jgi:hypothetical protein